SVSPWRTRYRRVNRLASPPSGEPRLETFRQRRERLGGSGFQPNGRPEVALRRPPVDDDHGNPPLDSDVEQTDAGVDDEGRPRHEERSGLAHDAGRSMEPIVRDELPEEHDVGFEDSPADGAVGDDESVEPVDERIAVRCELDLGGVVDPRV